MERAGSMMSDSSDDTDYVPAIVCPICSTPFDTELEAMTHVSVCIENESMRHDEDFARSFVSSGGADADASYSDRSSWRDADVPPAPSPMVDRDDYGSEESGEELVDDDSFPCPLCEKLFPVSKIEAHASRCMGGDALAAPLDEPPVSRFSPSPAAPAAPAAPASKPAEPVEVPEGHKSCPYCEKNFPEAEFDEHVQGHQPVTCPKCQKDFEMRLLADHEPVCIGPTSSCPFCNRDVRDVIFDEHVIDCQERANAEQRNILRESQEREALSSLRKFQFDEEELNERQHRALDYVVGYSSRLAAKSRQSLLKKFEKNGWNKETLSRVLIFIRDRAPIIIHIHPNVLNFLNKDRFYKNQFETGTSSGTLDRSVRTNWENRLFNKIYNDAKDKERVKYGVLNIVCDIRGVKPCLHYGDSYLLLKSEIRYRCTFSSKDSGYEDVYPSTVEYYEHVLNEFADAELREVVDVACGKKDAGDSSRISQYKELQIHGPVRLDQDVEALVMNVRHQHSPDILALATEFAERNRCNLLWCADP